MDIASSHKKQNLNVPTNIKLIYLPPGCTYIFQSLDLGIFRSFKSKYRNLLRTQYYMEFLNERKWNLTNNKGAIINIVMAANKIDIQVIFNCWIKSTLLAGHFNFIKETLLNKFNNKKENYLIMKKEEDSKLYVKKIIKDFIRIELDVTKEDEELLDEEDLHMDSNYIKENNDEKESILTNVEEAEDSASIMNEKICQEYLILLERTFRELLTKVINWI